MLLDGEMGNLDNLLIWDGHAGVYPHVDTDLSGLSYWREADVSFVSLNVYYDVMPAEDIFPVIHAYRRFIKNNHDKYLLVDKASDLEKARKSGMLAISFDLEGLNVLQGDPARLEELHGLGVRQALFAYNLNNGAAGGCHDDDTGLSDLGRQSLSTMNRIGMMVDASHCGFKSSLELAEYSSKPIVFSHSNPKSVWDHERNITDEQMKACAATGGVVGACGIGIFLGENDSSSEALVRSVVRIADTIGTEHTGISMDYFFPDVDLSSTLAGRPDYWPAGQQYDTKGITASQPSQFEEVISLMRKAGFHTSEIRAIVGGNFLRVAGEVWG